MGGDVVSRLRRGLPYGWWKSPDFWATVLFLFVACPILWVIIVAWWMDWPR